MNGIVRLNQFIELKGIEDVDPATAESMPEEVPAEPQTEYKDDKLKNLKWKRHNKIYKAKIVEPGFDPYHSSRQDNDAKNGKKNQKLKQEQKSRNNRSFSTIDDESNVETGIVQSNSIDISEGQISNLVVENSSSRYL